MQTLSFKINYEVLNFELEAQNNIDKIKIL